MIVPTEGESLYESYHSILSTLTGSYREMTVSGTNFIDFVIYKVLAQLCGAINVALINIDDISLLNANDYLNYVICLEYNNNNGAFHYIYRDMMGNIYDPYIYFQLYNTQGNCFIYALYLCRSLNYPRENLLININQFLEKKHNSGHIYYAVRQKNTQLVYECFVYNDYIIINWFIDKFMNDKNIIRLYTTEFNNFKRNDFNITNYGITNKNLTFNQYLNELKNLARDINNTYIMTWEQVANWDKEQQNYHVWNNSGIRNSNLINPLPILNLPNYINTSRHNNLSSQLIIDVIDNNKKTNINTVNTVELNFI